MPTARARDTAVLEYPLSMNARYARSSGSPCAPSEPDRKTTPGRGQVILLVVAHPVMSGKRLDVDIEARAGDARRATPRAKRQSDTLAVTGGRRGQNSAQVDSPLSETAELELAQRRQRRFVGCRILRRGDRHRYRHRLRLRWHACPSRPQVDQCGSGTATPQGSEQHRESGGTLGRLRDLGHYEHPHDSVSITSCKRCYRAVCSWR
jgi:hypothetical protein